MQRDTQFQNVSIDKITELLGDDGDLLEKSGKPQEDSNLAEIGAVSDTAKPTDEVGSEARDDVPRTKKIKKNMVWMRLTSMTLFLLDTDKSGNQREKSGKKSTRPWQT